MSLHTARTALNLRSYWATKLYVMTPVTLTGCPDNFVGENLAPRAACTATPLNRG